MVKTGGALFAQAPSRTFPTGLEKPLVETDDDAHEDDADMPLPMQAFR